jgi:putative spermidine/putrescine transport system substrate-binding protein/spermidine/putrescine transport system substrate-binding protein
VTYVGGVDEQIAKLKASAGRDYDVVAVDTASLPTFVAQRLLAPLAPEAVAPAVARLVPEFRPLERQTVDGRVYGLPFAWGSLGLVYDRKTFPQAPESWAVLWDPQYRGRVIALDDANNNVNFAAIALGIADPFRLDDAQFAAVKRKLVALKGNLLTYYAGFDEGTTIWSENDVVLMFAMGELNAIALRKQGYDVGYTVPREGAVGWLDNLAVSAGSPRPDLALRWIDFVLQEKIGADMTRKSGYGSTTVSVPADGNFARLKWARHPEDYGRRQALWNEVKASVP